MPKIIFIDAPTTPQERIGKLSRIINLSRDRPHLGILTLAAVARQNGWNAAVVDPYPFQWTDEAIATQVQEFGPDIIGISSHTLGVLNGNRLAGLLKERLPGVPILNGGPHATSAPADTLRECGNYDILVIGEGEETLLELLKALPGRPLEETLSSINGIAFRAADGRIVLSGHRDNTQPLDSLPMPAWDLLPQYPFLYSPSLSSGAGSRPTGSLFTTRGCPWNCTFCDRGVFGDRLRAFSARAVMDQVLHLYHVYGIRELMFGDDTLFVDRDRMFELAELLIGAKLDLRWECMARVVDANDKLYAAVKRSGCFEISYGIESAVDEVSQNVAKPLTRKIARRAVEITKKAGIRARGYFIFGLPGDTERTLQETGHFILHSGLDDAAIFACTPYPGSALYERAHEYGTFEKRWDKMNNVDIVFVPHGLTPEKIEAMRMAVMRKFYVNPRFMWNWGRRLVRDNGWAELGRRAGVYTRFFGHMLGEFVSGLGRGA
ncbi:MAG: radical SAM protein [Nitrospirae bacterium]|nr:radical SAM protein [Nitrospirota bacterium]